MARRPKSTRGSRYSTSSRPSRGEATHASIVRKAPHLALALQVVEMGDRLAHREHHLMIVERALEEERQRLIGGEGLSATFQQPLEPPLVVLVELGDARVQAAEHALM